MNMVAQKVRCQLCGLQIFNFNDIEYLTNNVPIHKGQICPIFDVNMRHIIKSLILADNSEKQYEAIQQLDKISRYHDKSPVICPNCEHQWETIVRSNSTRCKKCGTSIYIDKYGNQR